MLSVGVIGARRKRQGIGEHVARYLARRGAAVRAVAGTTPETAEEARAALATRYGIQSKAYASVEEMLAREPLDAVAICSPIEAHAAALDLAARSGLHALCEKPLIFDPERDGAADVAAFAARFAAAGRYLGTITQWPFTLAAFRRLHPDAPLGAPRHFAMRLSPIARGEAMLIDSLSHPLSLLRALVGPGETRPRGTAWTGDEAAKVRFDYSHRAGVVACEVALVRCLEQPRPAGYAIDGFEACREIRLPDYSMTLVAGARSVPLDDPLDLLVEDFLARAARGEAPDAAGLASDAAGLEALVRDAARRGGRTK